LTHFSIWRIIAKMPSKNMCAVIVMNGHGSCRLCATREAVQSFVDGFNEAADLTGSSLVVGAYDLKRDETKLRRLLGSVEFNEMIKRAEIVESEITKRTHRFWD
jgi:hypothetical protein